MSAGPAGQVSLTQNGNTVSGSPFNLADNGDGTSSASYSYTPTAPETDVFAGGYLGAPGSFNPSNSQPYTETVNDPTQNTVTTVTATPNPAVPGQPVTVNIHVAPAS